MRAPIDMSVCNGNGCDKKMFCKRCIENYEIDESARWYVNSGECIEHDHRMLIHFSTQDKYDRFNTTMANKDLL